MGTPQSKKKLEKYLKGSYVTLYWASLAKMHPSFQKAFYSSSPHILVSVNLNYYLINSSLWKLSLQIQPRLSMATIQIPSKQIKHSDYWKYIILALISFLKNVFSHPNKQWKFGQIYIILLMTYAIFFRFYSISW